MPDYTITLTAAERIWLDRQLHWLLNDQERPLNPDWQPVAADIYAKLRAAPPAAPGPLERLEAWVDRQPAPTFAIVDEITLMDDSEPTYRVELCRGSLRKRSIIRQAEGSTLAAAVDAALAQVEATS